MFYKKKLLKTSLLYYWVIKLHMVMKNFGVTPDQCTFKTTTEFSQFKP